MKKYPLQKTFMFLEPGPALLISTADENKANVMTLTWSMVLDFTPRFAFSTGPWNYSYQALMKNRDCVIAVPTFELAKKVVQIGSCSGREVDKFEKFGLTALPASQVQAPLIKECYANIECKIVDYLEKHNIFILDAVETWIDEKKKAPRFFHARGDGHFIVDGKKMDYRKIMIEKLPPGV